MLFLVSKESYLREMVIIDCLFEKVERDLSVLLKTRNDKITNIIYKII